jgi:DNA polymerase-4
MHTIIHMDLDAFFCAMEEQRDPSLRGRAFAVGGQAQERGVVASCSYAARRFGVRSAMPMSRALSMCPNLIRVPARHDVYRAASAQVMALLHTVTPLVQQISIDEAFLDVSALMPLSTAPDTVPPEAHEEAHHLARRLQRRIQQELGLSASMGVASNKLVAKIASDYGKALYARSDEGKSRGHSRGKPDEEATNSAQTSPQAIYVVPPGDEAAFLAPLPASALSGVGPKTEAALASLGLVTIGDIAAYPPEELLRRFGQHGYDLSRHARGIDRRPVVTSRDVKSISSETTFVRDVDEWDSLQETLEELVEDVVRRLQKHRMQATTVKLKLRWPDFSTPTRQLTLPTPTDQADAIGAAAETLLRQLGEPLRTKGTSVRLLGVGVTGLSARQQLSLWDVAETSGEAVAASGEAVAAEDVSIHHPLASDPVAEAYAAHSRDLQLRREQEQEEKQHQLQQTIQALQQRFGTSIVRRGCDL